MFLIGIRFIWLALPVKLCVQLRLNLVGIPVSSEYSNPDILLTLNATSGGTGLNIYCNPGYGTFADPYGTYPGPGYAQWFSGESHASSEQ